MKKFFGFCIVALLALTVSSCAKIDSAEIGIKFQKYGLTNQGEVSATPCSGYVVYNPMTTGIYTIEALVRNVDYNPFDVPAKGGGLFTADVYYSYRLMRECGVDYFTKYRKPLSDIENTTLRNYVYSAYKSLLGLYTPEEAVDNRTEIENRIEEEIKAVFLENGFMIDEFVGTIIPPSSLTATINAKNEAVQVALRAENEVALATAQAKINIAKAEGEAKAMKIKADAEAYYNRTIANSITPTLVQKQAIEKWSGNLPQYNGGGAVPFIDVK